MLLENSLGPETENLAQHLRLEHYTNGNFVTSVNNSCVSFDASKMSLTNSDLNHSLNVANSATGGGINGKTKAIELSSPGQGNQVASGISYEACEWLKYD